MRTHAKPSDGSRLAGHPTTMSMAAAGRPRAKSLEFTPIGTNENKVADHRFAPLSRMMAPNVNESASIRLDGTVLRQGGAAAPPMPGPLDGLGIPTPKDVGDWLEEMFGKGTNPNGPKGPDDKDGKG